MIIHSEVKLKYQAIELNIDSEQNLQQVLLLTLGNLKNPKNLKQIKRTNSYKILKLSTRVLERLNYLIW